MNLGAFVQRTARHFGYDVVYFDRLRLLKRFGIDLVLDVGANVGQYGAEIRSLGYGGRIVSFEPLTRAFDQLERRTRSDKLWQAVNCALGNRDESSEIHISTNSVSSSLLDILPQHVQAAPESEYAAKETIRVSRLDSLFGGYHRTGDRVFMKLDTQGYEYQVLQGATESLPSILGVQVEMSLVPLYAGERQFHEMVPYLTSLGYWLMSIEPVFRDKATGQMLAVDGIFFRETAQIV